MKIKKIFLMMGLGCVALSGLSNVSYADAGDCHRVRQHHRWTTVCDYLPLDSNALNEINNIMQSASCFPKEYNKQTYLTYYLQQMQSSMPDLALAQQQGTWNDYVNNYTNAVNTIPTCTMPIAQEVAYAKAHPSTASSDDNDDD